MNELIDSIKTLTVAPDEYLVLESDKILSCEAFANIKDNLTIGDITGDNFFVKEADIPDD